LESEKKVRAVQPPQGYPLIKPRTLWWLLAIVGITWALFQGNIFGRDLFNEGGWPLVREFLRASLHPDLSRAFLTVAIKATLITLAYAVTGSTFSVLLGVVGGILSSRVWWESVLPPKIQSSQRLGGYKTPWLGVRAVLAVPRAIHEIIWGLFFVNILGLTPLTGILAIAIPFGAITAKVFSEILDETPHQPMNALLSSGVGLPKAMLYGLFPAALPNLVSYAFYRFECSIRSATVLGIIGAGGLGYEIFLSLQSLQYEQMWTLFFALFLLSGLTDSWSRLLRRRLGSSHRIALAEYKAPRQGSQTKTNDPVIMISLFGGILLTGFSFWVLRPDFFQLFAPRTIDLLTGVLHDSIPPTVARSQLGELFNLSFQTLAMSILAITFAGTLGIVFSFFATSSFPRSDGRKGTNKIQVLVRLALAGLTRGFLLVLRAIPAPIWALILLYVMFPGILPGAIALGLYTLGILGRLMAEVVENLDQRPLQALSSQGAPEPQVFLYGVLPATMPGFLAYILYRWEVCIRATVIVGLVGAGGLGRLLTEQLSSFDYSGVTTTLIFFLGLTILVDMISVFARGNFSASYPHAS